MLNITEREIKYINGIGVKKAELYQKLGVTTVGDLLCYYPRDYEDWSIITPIEDIQTNEICVIQAKVQFRPVEQRIYGGKTLYKTVVYDDTGEMELVFFNNKFIPRILHEGQSYYFRGKAVFNRCLSMTSPEFMKENKILSVVPIYPTTAGLTSTQIATSASEALKLLPNNVPDCLNDDIREKYGLCTLSYALHNIHFPVSSDAVKIARNRLIFEELLVLQLSMKKIKEKNKSHTSHVLSSTHSDEFNELLPFNLTNAQKNSIADCLSDMKKNIPMNRLLQGDVGSGKTAVAAAICHTAAKNGIQCAMMAPTEILATQHFHSLNELLGPANIKVALLTGSLTPKRKQIVYDALVRGEIDLVVGTHALISKSVEFKNLGLVITDEQHRFGVKQRSTLAQKGLSPHMLVMSATPIPRTLALMIYGDLDISILNELPKGRQKIETYAINSNIRLRAFNYIKKHIEEGRQAYIICPLIEEGENELSNIETYYEFLKEHFTEETIGILHGKMKAKEKDIVMEKFVKNEVKLLLSTTVVEVGVDVPNAVIMLIENAERFGLSQLHQLRGRVGRGKHKSTCILLTDTQNELSRERMRFMCESSDGFKIAEADLQMRGPGDFFGKRQHGLPQLKIADMANDMETLSQAQNCADEILTNDPNLKLQPLLAKKVQELYVNSGNANAMTL